MPIIGSLGSSQDPDIDENILIAVQKETEAGYNRDFISEMEIYSDSPVIRRFGKRQDEIEAGLKARPIDDYRQSLINLAITQIE